MSSELQLHLRVSKDQLDAVNTKNLQPESEVNQLTSELNTVGQSLALALTRPAGSSMLRVALKSPKLLKIFADPGMYDGSRGKNFEEWWTCVHTWQSENAAILQGAASIHTVLSRMVGRDASTFACAWLNKMIRGKQWTWAEFTRHQLANCQKASFEKATTCQWLILKRTWSKQEVGSSF